MSHACRIGHMQASWPDLARGQGAKSTVGCVVGKSPIENGDGGGRQRGIWQHCGLCCLGPSISASIIHHKRTQRGSLNRHQSGLSGRNSGQRMALSFPIHSRSQPVCQQEPHGDCVPPVSSGGTMQLDRPGPFLRVLTSLGLAPLNPATADAMAATVCLPAALKQRVACLSCASVSWTKSGGSLRSFEPCISSRGNPTVPTLPAAIQMLPAGKPEPNIEGGDSRCLPGH